MSDEISEETAFLKGRAESRSTYSSTNQFLGLDLHGSSLRGLEPFEV